jgi:hypothetical protein
VLVNELAVVDQYHYYGFALSRSRFAYSGFALSRSRQTLPDIPTIDIFKRPSGGYFAGGFFQRFPLIPSAGSKP